MPYKHTRRFRRLESESTTKLLRCWCGRGGKLCPSVKLCYHERGDSGRNSRGRAAGGKGTTVRCCIWTLKAAGKHPSRCARSRRTRQNLTFSLESDSTRPPTAYFFLHKNCYFKMAFYSRSIYRHAGFFFVLNYRKEVKPRSWVTTPNTVRHFRFLRLQI